MLDDKLKIIITEKQDLKLVEAGIIRIKYPNNVTEDIVVIDEIDYHLIISSLNKSTKIDSGLRHRCIISFGNCFFPINEIPITNKNVYGSFIKFLDDHPYIHKLYNEFCDRYPEKDGDYDQYGRMTRKRKLIPHLICVSPQTEEEIREMEDRNHCRPD